MAQDRVDDRFEAGGHAALICNDADRAAAEIAPGLAQKDFVAELDAGRRRRLGRKALRRQRKCGAAG
jgi:hypothetical protein